MKRDKRRKCCDTGDPANGGARGGEAGGMAKGRSRGSARGFPLMNRRGFLQTMAVTGAATLPGARWSLAADADSRSHTLLLRSGWQTVNIGDIGHTPGTLRYLREELPDCRTILWLERTTEAVTAMLRRRFPEVEIVRGRLNERGEASTPELQEAFDKAAMLLHNSGMHFNRFWGGGPVGHLEACKRRGKLYCCYGQSFDGFREDTQAKTIELLSQTAAIYCRDVESLYYLRRVGVHPPILEFGPDGCFGIDVRDDAKAEAFLDEHGLARGEFLSVTLRSNTPKLDGGSDELNPAERSEQEVAEDERWSAKLRRIIETWVEHTGRKVLLSPEVDKEIEPAKRLLLDRLPEHVRSNVVHRQTFWNVDEAASVYARARALVSMEPHSCIIGLANGTPSMHLFSAKHGLKAWMFRDIGLPEWLLNIDEEPASDAWLALKRIDEHHDHARRKVSRAMTFVNERSKEMMADLRRTMDERA